MMLRRGVIILVCSLGLAVFDQPSAYSQEETYAPQFWLIFDGRAQSGQDAAYIQAHKELNAALVETGVDGFRRWGARNHSESGHYVFGHRLRTFHEIGDLHQKWSELLQDEAVASIYGSISKSSRFFDSSVWLERPDLDYRPEDPRLNPNRALWTRQIHFFVEPGKIGEFLDTWNEYKTLLKENGVREYVWVFEQILGNENPVLLFNVTCNGPDDFDDAYSRTNEQLGAKGDELRGRMATLVRRIVEADVELLPELTTIGAQE